MIDPGLIYMAGAGVLGGGIAWGAVVASVRGIKDSQVELRSDLKEHVAADAVLSKELLQSVARIEGHLERMIRP